MKKISNYLVVILLTIILLPTQLFATSALLETSIPASPTDESAKIDAMVSRLNEIKDMDKSDLSAAERKELREEVRNIKDSVKEGRGLYLSVGAIIIIILLLIILL